MRYIVKWSRFYGADEGAALPSIHPLFAPIPAHDYCRKQKTCWVLTIPTRF
jgi:hypothetical protein